MNQKKIEKFASIIRRELGEIILREIELPKDSFITTTKILVSPDLKRVDALIGVTPPEKTQEVLETLAKKTKYLRSLLAHRLNIRRVPSIHFLEDKSLRIEQLLREIEKENKAE